MLFALFGVCLFPAVEWSYRRSRFGKEPPARGWHRIIPSFFPPRATRVSRTPLHHRTPPAPSLTFPIHNQGSLLLRRWRQLLWRSASEIFPFLPRNLPAEGCGLTREQRGALVQWARRSRKASRTGRARTKFFTQPAPAMAQAKGSRIGEDWASASRRVCRGTVSDLSSWWQPCGAALDGEITAVVAASYHSPWQWKPISPPHRAFAFDVYLFICFGRESLPPPQQCKVQVGP